MSQGIDASSSSEASRAASEEPQLRLHNPNLHKLYREIDRLSDEDQQALVILLDSLVKRSQMGQVLAG